MCMNLLLLLGTVGCVYLLKWFVLEQEENEREEDFNGGAAAAANYTSESRSEIYFYFFFSFFLVFIVWARVTYDRYSSGPSFFFF